MKITGNVKAEPLTIERLIVKFVRQSRNVVHYLDKRSQRFLAVISMQSLNLISKLLYEKYAVAYRLYFFDLLVCSTNASQIILLVLK